MVIKTLFLKNSEDFIFSLFVSPPQNGRHWYEDVSHFHLIQSHAFCIVAWVAGEAAVIMESLPVSEVKDVLHELLALFLGKPDLPPPCDLVRLV